jgi:hypothetical protein
MSSNDPSVTGAQGQPQGQGGLPTQPQVVTYAGTKQQQDAALAQAQEKADPVGAISVFLGDTSSPQAQAAAQAAKYATSEGQKLSHGLTMKTGVHTGGHHYLGYSQDELHQMVNTNVDSSDLQAKGQAFTDIGNTFAEMGQRMDQTVSTASGSWQGKAAQGAATFTTSVSSWHGTSAQGGQYAGNQMFEQSQTLDQARASMPPPVAAPTTADIQHALMSYDPIDPSSISGLNQLANQVSAAQSNHQQMARVVQQYDGQLGNTSTLPEFAAPAQFNPTPPPAASSAGNGGVSGGGSAAGSQFSGSQGAGGRAAYVGHPGSGGSGGGYAPPAVSGAPGATGGSGPVASGGTTTQGSGWGSPPAGTGQQGGGSPVPGGGAGSGTGSGGGWSGMPGGMPMGGFGGAGGGAGSGGSGGWGPTGSGGPGSGGAGGAGSGPRSGVGALAAEDAAVENGAAGARGTSGSAGMGGMGAGRGGGRGEDSEHKRAAYLVEGDPEGLFGTDEKTTPPVIGE